MRPATLFHEAAHAAGVPTPRVRRTTDRARCSPGRRTRRSGCTSGWTWESRPRPGPGAGRRGGGRRPPGRGRTSTGRCDPWYASPSAPRAGTSWSGSCAPPGRRSPGGWPELRDELVALESWLEPPAALRTCHRDLWADNVLPTADGGVCVIDWENSGTGRSRARNSGCVLFEFGRNDPGRARALTAAYRQAGGPGGCRARRLLDADRAARAHHRDRGGVVAGCKRCVGEDRRRRLGRRSLPRTPTRVGCRRPAGRGHPDRPAPLLEGRLEPGPPRCARETHCQQIVAVPVSRTFTTCMLHPRTHLRSPPRTSACLRRGRSALRRRSWVCRSSPGVSSTSHGSSDCSAPDPPRPPGHEGREEQRTQQQLRLHQ